MVSRPMSMCPSVRLSYVRLSAFSFANDNLSSIQCILSNLVYLLNFETVELGL